MKYRVIIRPQAEKRIIRLPKKVQSRIRIAIRSLGDEPRPVGSLKLQTGEGFRIRIGDYKVMYEIADRDKLVDVKYVAHRKDAY